MKLRFTQRAVADLTAIADHIRVDDPAAAERVRAAILNAIDNIARFPKIGRAQSMPGVRKHVSRRFPYFIYYRLDGEADEIAILTILHPSRGRPFSDE